MIIVINYVYVVLAGWCEQLVHEMQNAGLISLVPLGRSRTTARQTVIGGQYRELITRKTDRGKSIR